MTVVLVILLLISLTIPIFVNLKMNARSALCKSQLRQMGVLITSYTAENNGYLPNDDTTDIPAPINNNHWSVKAEDKLNNELYRNWNGHLLPYLDGVRLTDKYTRYANLNLVKPSGYWDATTLPVPVSPKTKLNQGWVVLEDAFLKGGYDDLKLFICPEVHANTMDIDVSNKYLGFRMPRISCMLNGVGSGIPATYLANRTFFGFGSTVNSYRMDEIDNVSNKAFLLEGGVANGSGWAYARSLYYYLGNLPYEGYDLGIGHPGDCANRFVKTPDKVSYQKLNYVHDNHQTFWISIDGNIPNFAAPNYVDYRHEVALKFNAQYAGKAYMIPCTIDSSSYDPPYTIVSYVDPYPNPSDTSKTIFDDFLKANPGIGTSWGNFTAFIDEPNEYHYLVGDMNVLFGDGSVLTKDLGWLSTNRINIGFPARD